MRRKKYKHSVMHFPEGFSNFRAKMIFEWSLERDHLNLSYVSIYATSYRKEILRCHTSSTADTFYSLFCQYSIYVDIVRRSCI